MLFEAFLKVTDRLQRGTFEEFEQARSEMAALCVKVDNNHSLFTRQEIEDLEMSVAYTLTDRGGSAGSQFVERLEKLWDKLQAQLESGLTMRPADGACTCAKNPIIKPVDGVCPVCNGTPRR